MSEIPLRDGLERLLADWQETLAISQEVAIADGAEATGLRVLRVCIDKVSLLLRAVPPAQEAAPLRQHRFDCDECGKGVPVDEDGCCRLCGADARPIAAAPAQAPPAPRAPSPDLVAQIRALRCYVMVRDMTETLVLAYDQENRDKSYPDAKSHEVAEGEEEWVRWADLAALLPPEDGQP